MPAGYLDCWKAKSSLQLTSFCSLVIDSGTVEASGNGGAKHERCNAVMSLGLSQLAVKSLGELAALFCDDPLCSTKATQQQACWSFGSQSAEQLDDAAKRVLLSLQMAATVKGPQRQQKGGTESGVSRFSIPRSRSTADLPRADSSKSLLNRTASYQSMNALLLNTGKSIFADDGMCPNSGLSSVYRVS